jgi:hypothetical protein
MIEGTGIKNPSRLLHFMTPIALYRTIASADGAVDPVAPPAVPFLDARRSGRGLNDLMVYVRFTGSPAASVLAVWVKNEAGYWFKVGNDLSVAGNSAIVVHDVPALRIAVTLTSGAAMEISLAVSE